MKVYLLIYGIIVYIELLRGVDLLSALIGPAIMFAATLLLYGVMTLFSYRDNGVI